MELERNNIEKCDEWIDTFKKVHDTLKSIQLDKGSKCIEMKMELSIGSSCNKDIEKDNKKGMAIDLCLKVGDNILLEGISIFFESIYGQNKDFYRYLAASSLDYYLSENCDSPAISQWYDSKEKSHYYGIDISNGIGFMHKFPSDAPNLKPIIPNLMLCYNIGFSTDAIINNLRERVINQQFSSIVEEKIDNSIANCKCFSQLGEKELINRK